MPPRTGYGPYRPPIRATVTSRRRRASTTPATIGSGQTLKRATLAAGVVTAGEAAKPTAVVGVTIQPTHETEQPVGLLLRSAARWIPTNRAASRANVAGPLMPGLP